MNLEQAIRNQSKFSNLQASLSLFVESNGLLRSKGRFVRDAKPTSCIGSVQCELLHSANNLGCKSGIPIPSYRIGLRLQLYVN